MSQEDRPEAQTAASTAVEEFTTDARDFLSSKRTGPVLMRVILVNKSETEDIKVWYRLATKNAAGANVSLPHSSRKAYLSAKNQRPIESLIKIDPTKDFFFDNMDDVQVELQVTVRDQEDAAGGRGKYGRRVHYQETNDSVGGGFSTANQANYFTASQGFDEDDRDDDRDDDHDDGEAYQDYQSNPTYAGAQENNEHELAGNLLQLHHNLQPQSSPEAAGFATDIQIDRQSNNGSTDAVLDGNAGDREDAQSQDENQFEP